MKALMVTLVVTAAAVGPVHAQGAPADEAAAAQALFAQRKFADAGAAFERAYEAGKSDDHLWRAAESYRLAENRPKALELYQRYLAVAPDGDHASRAYDWIDALTAAPRKGPVVERPSAGVPEPVVTPAPAPRPAAPAFDPDPVQASARCRQRRAGLIIGAVGVVTLGAGIYFGLRAKSQASEVSDATKWSHELADTAAAGERNETIGIVLGSVGAAALVTGGIFYLLGSRRVRARGEVGLRLVPTVTPRAAGVNLSARF